MSVKCGLKEMRWNMNTEVDNVKLLSWDLHITNHEERRFMIKTNKQGKKRNQERKRKRKNEDEEINRIGIPYLNPWHPGLGMQSITLHHLFMNLWDLNLSDLISL